MDYEKTLEELKHMKVETGSFVCLGCGHEHNCSIHGCAILRDAVECIEELKRVLQESEAARADLGKRLAAAQQEMAETKSERDATVEDLRQLGFLTAKLCEYCRREGDCEISDDEFDEKWPDCFEWRCLQRRA